VRRTFVLVTLIVALVGASLLIVAMNDQSKSSESVHTPSQTAEAWFAALNAHDLTAAQHYFARSDEKQMEWSSWPPRFTHLKCSSVWHLRQSAEVRCTFDTIDDPASGMSHTNYWSIDLARSTPGPWLITSYGQP